MVARREGFEPPTARSVAWCSTSIWSAPDRSGLLTLDAPSIWTDPVGSRRIVWMIRRMIKQGRQIDEPDRMAQPRRLMISHERATGVEVRPRRCA